MIFYPRRLWKVVLTSCQWGLLAWEFHRIQKKVKINPRRFEYTDVALSPVGDEEEGSLSESPISLGPHSLLHIEKHKTTPVTARKGWEYQPQRKSPGKIQGQPTHKLI